MCWGVGGWGQGLGVRVFRVCVSLTLRLRVQGLGFVEGLCRCTHPAPMIKGLGYCPCTHPAPVPLERHGQHGGEGLQVTWPRELRHQRGLLNRIQALATDLRQDHHMAGGGVGGSGFRTTKWRGGGRGFRV